MMIRTLTQIRMQFSFSNQFCSLCGHKAHGREMRNKHNEPFGAIRPYILTLYVFIVRPLFIYLKNFCQYLLFEEKYVKTTTYYSEWIVRASFFIKIFSIIFCGRNSFTLNIGIYLSHSGYSSLLKDGAVFNFCYST